MAKRRCAGCGTAVSVAGGIAAMWSLDPDKTGGMTLEFDSDDTEHFLCFDCIDQLPDDPTAADVDSLDTE